MSGSSAGIQAYRERAREWIEANLERIPEGGLGYNPMASDPLDRFSRARELQRRLCDAGYAGISFPREYGGQGLTPEHQSAFTEECLGFEIPLRFSMPTLGIIGATILDFGSEAQKRRYIPAMLRGTELWVQLLSEPSCGSDLAGAITRGDRDGEDWILNGSKVWSSAAYACDFGLCLARTNWEVPKHAGLTMFIVELGQPGIELRQIRQVDGSDEFCEEFFDHLRLRADSVLGEVDQGWSVAARLLSHERDSVGGSSPYIGNVLANREQQGRFDTVDLARAKGRGGRLAAEAHVRARVGEQLVERLSTALRTGAIEGPAGAILKLYRATTVMRNVSIALEVAGSDAVVWSPGANPIARKGEPYLLRQGQSLAGGSNEMQRNLISERVLGMPREDSPDRGVPFSKVARAKTRD
jgi:alkylation response protein AidB-like acyl-CoA dehydrogenase